MPPQARVSDKSQVPNDSHGCPGCPHPCVGPGIEGSPDVITNGLPTLRVGDPGIHSSCCGPNKTVCKAGSGNVLVNNKPAHRQGDQVQHCGGMGTRIEGSHNVMTGG